MEYKNNEALMLAIQGDMADVIDSISNDVLALMQQHIEEIVYDPFSPRVYQRRKEDKGFLGSWTTDISYDDNGNAIGKIYSDPSDEFMELNPEQFVHGHPEESSGQTTGLFGTMIDRREIMDVAIAEGTNYDFYLMPKEGEEQSSDENWWTKPRDYFTPTIGKLNDGLFEEYANNALRKHEFDFEKSFSGTSLF